jgi:transketolase
MGKATREAYGEALAKLIVEDEKIVVLDADLTGSTKTADAKKACPERHFNIGIAECNMTGIAAGFASSGYSFCINICNVCGRSCLGTSKKLYCIS